MEMLNFYEIPLEGKEVVIVNRSLVVGKPLAMLLLDRNATVTICHSRTKNLAEKMKKADVVVSAVGKAELFGPECFDAHSVVIDVGINKREDGSMCGDVRFSELESLVSAASPVPRGIGAVTSAVLLRNVVYSCRQLSGLACDRSFEERWG
jgi:methylenetetrahydrofolate dehydrogenase (NADP+)/methenyltetrahydrofolate cyclohydrolase